NRAAAIDDGGSRTGGGGSDLRSDADDAAVVDENAAPAVEVRRCIDEMGVEIGPAARSTLDAQIGRHSGVSSAGKIAGESIEDRHAHCHAHLDLFANDRLHSVGDSRI